MLAAMIAAAAQGQQGGLRPGASLMFCLDSGVFAEDNGLSMDTDTAVLFVMANAYNAMQLAAGLPGLPPSRGFVAAGAALPLALQHSSNFAGVVNAIAAAGGYGGIADLDERQYAQMCAVGQTRGIRYLLDLVACCQVKNLKAKNVKAYFMSMDETKVSGQDIIAFVLSVKSDMPDIASNAALLVTLTQNDFMAYHLGYSSTAPIVNEAMTFLGGNVALVFSAATQAAVAASMAAPHDRVLNNAIPRAAVLHGYAFGKALKKDYGDWYQGEKAKASEPASRYNSILAMYKRIAELTDNTLVIGAAANQAAVFAAMPANCIGV